jgi:FkbM family methyltransferase
MIMRVKKLLRDSPVINLFIRNIIRLVHTRFRWFNNLVNQYRIYGNVSLHVNRVKFTLYTQGDDFIANELYYDLGYETNEFNLVKSLVKSGKYLVDVGANTGIFSIFASKVNAQLSIICFEPHPSNFTRLIKNIELNKLTNVQSFQEAIGSSRAEIVFTVPADLSISCTASATAGFTTNFHSIKHKEILVQQTTLDEALQDVPLTSSDILKIDVEYYELEVLKGAESTFVHKRPLVIIEILQYENLVSQFPEMRTKLSENHADSVFDFFNRHKYYAYSIDNSGLRFIDSIQGQKNRNFLFTPYKLEQLHYSFCDIETESFIRS